MERGALPSLVPQLSDDEPVCGGCRHTEVLSVRCGACNVHSMYVATLRLLSRRPRSFEYSRAAKGRTDERG